MADPIVCIESINNVRTSVQGNDPRTWMKACAIDTLLKGKSGKHFKNCLIGKMESTKAAHRRPSRVC